MGEAAIKLTVTDMGTIRPRGGPEMELQDFFNAHEASIGLRSSFGSMLSALEGTRAGSGPGDYEVRGVELGSAPSRNVRVWRALRRMDEAGQRRELVVLHRLYGAVKCAASPELRKALPADLMQIATLTSEAETVREELACGRGLEWEARVRLRCVRPVAEASKEIAQLTEEWARLARVRVKLAAKLSADTGSLEKLNARRQRLQEKLDEGTVMDEDREKLKARLGRVEALCAESATTRSGRLGRRLEKLDAEIEACGEELDRHGSGVNENAAVLSTYAAADAGTDHDEALEWQLGRLRHKGDERVVWIAELTRQCRQLQKDALDAYRQARSLT